MDIKIKQRAIDGLVFDDFLRLNKEFSHELYKKVKEVKPGEFEFILAVMWISYCRGN